MDRYYEAIISGKHPTKEFTGEHKAFIDSCNRLSEYWGNLSIQEKNNVKALVLYRYPVSLKHYLRNCRQPKVVCMRQLVSHHKNYRSHFLLK